jgi:hypothetical protein
LQSVKFITVRPEVSKGWKNGGRSTKFEIEQCLGISPSLPFDTSGRTVITFVRYTRA